MWKRIATLQNWFNLLADDGLRMVPADEGAQKKQEEEFRGGLYKSLIESQQYLHEEMLFIPKHTTDVALEAERAAVREKYNFANFGQFLSSHPDLRQTYLENRGQLPSRVQ